MNEPPTCFSLFSGIGGMDFGLHRAGFRHVAFCEGGGDPNGTKEERQQYAQGKYRRAVLAARWPGVPIYEDVVRVGKPTSGGAADGLRAPAHDGRREAGAGIPDDLDLLCGGFPCQDLSVAGRQKGLAGERSGLFFEFARITESLRPQWVLVENVPGLLSSNGGRDFGVVLGTLADIGYGVAWRVVDSRFFGVPQRRRRVFVLGTVANDDPRAAAERAGEILAVGTRCPGHPATGTEAGPDVAVASLSSLGTGGPDDNDGQAGRVIAYAAPAPVVSFDAEQSYHEPDELAYLTRKLRRAVSSPEVGVRRLTPTECERLQALPDGWTQLGDTPDSRRYAALGDAVTASVSEWIGRRLVAYRSSGPA